ncbi:hypothetical protein PPROV_000298100 [Pycnococcus provasolii]|uniref:Carbamoyl phosphate synthase small chain, chloroplastic n=1 Tax=Pycnococcus provasolii TaxID=41880 RepID=A0A830HGK4_9CHLO|nr:hypothetical protein PPROV_000298100 [Pycnococcus provasolii]
MSLALRVYAASSSSPFKPLDARLVLADGSVWKGTAFGARGTATGEVVFNTSLTGYQEILTDPSYAGQFVSFTCPHIGNVGTNTDDEESTKVHLGATIIHELSPMVSNHRNQKDLDTYLKEQNVLGIEGVDTRAITLRLRETGCLNGTISTDDSLSDDELLEMAKSFDIEGKDLISTVTTAEPYEWKDSTDEEWEFAGDGGAQRVKVVAYDFGVKRNILRRLASYGCDITVVPASFPADEVIAMNPDGVFLSNGPGDPSAVPYAVENTKKLVGKYPIFGICMGHQVLGQALGGSTYKLKFGHHGGNHPCKNIIAEGIQQVEITAQNHNFAVDVSAIGGDVMTSHINLNDQSCAGIESAEKQCFGIQYHPEASPGPHDADPAFKKFVDMCRA